MFKKQTVEVAKQGNVNHAIIIDRSGSMYGSLNQVIDDVQAMLPKLRNGDTLSVAWFSTEGGEYEWFIRNHIISPQSTEFLMKVLDNYRRTVGMTCFSEVLVSAQDVFAKMPAGNDTYLTFLTDGHPVTRDNRKEEKKTLEALRALKVDSAVFIGYGSYYNKGFMVQMAQAANGTLVHASQPKDIRASIADFIENADPMVVINLRTNEAFYTTGGGVYKAKAEENKVFVPSSAREVYYLSSDGEMDEEAAYGYAYLLMTEAKQDEAIEMLGKVGDVALIDKVSKAFTNEEYGEAQNALLSAALFSNERFKGGKNLNYLPDPNAYCLLDLLNDLNQEGVYFLPRSEHFKYNRIGAKRYTKDGYAKFIEDDEQKSPFTTLVWHGSQANVSLSATIKGTVDLGPQAALYGLPNPYPCVQIRNYALVKDGVLNIKELPVVVPPDVAKGIAGPSAQYLGDDTYVIDLSSLPIINRTIANEAVGSVGEYLSYAEQELMLEGAYKVYRHFYNLLNPNKVKDGELTEQQQVFLKDKGIVNGIYSPPSEPADFEDVYLAKEVVIAKKGYSSFPSVEKVMTGGKLNGPGAVMYGFIPDALKMGVKELEAKVKEVKDRLKAVREPMYKARFAIIVGNKWFTDLTERDGATVGDWTVTLKEKQVKF